MKSFRMFVALGILLILAPAAYGQGHITPAPGIPRALYNSTDNTLAADTYVASQKMLREYIAAHGGGGVPTTITAANEATDTTCFPAFFTAATGDLGPKTNANFTLDSSATGNFTYGKIRILYDGKIQYNPGTGFATIIDPAVPPGDLAVGTGLSISSGSGTGALANGGATVGVATHYAIPQYVTFTTGGTTDRAFTLPDQAATLLYSSGALGTPASGTLSNCTGTPLVSPTPGTIAGTGGGTYYPSTDGTNTGTKVNFFTITALTGTAVFALPPGTWNQGDKLIIRVKSATAQTLNFTTNSTVWRAGTDAALPTTTAGSSKTQYIVFLYNSTDSRFDYMAKADGF